MIDIENELAQTALRASFLGFLSPGDVKAPPSLCDVSRNDNTAYRRTQQDDMENHARVMYELTYSLL